MSAQRITSAALAGLAIALGVIAMFVPFASVEDSEGGLSAEIVATVWRTEFKASGFGSDLSDEKAWTHDDLDDEDGIGQIRAAGPLLAVAAGAALLGLVLVVALRGPLAGGSTGLLSCALFGVGIYLLAAGLADWFNGEQQWEVGFWLAIGAGVAALASGVLGLVARRSA